MGKYQEKASLFDRFLYAFIGLFSGALISPFTVLPICWAFLRWTGTYFELFWMLWTAPLVFAGVMAIWGFIATNTMVETLSYWWTCVVDRYSN